MAGSGNMTKDVPGGRIGRMARLGTLALDAVRRRTAEEAADQASRVLGELRGLAAKVGQMASYVDGLVPEDKRDAFEASLAMLRAQAPRSRWSEVRALVETELGGPLASLFATFEEEPAASASIGQVHRATLHDGREVAVKVQHPGIRAAVESDLASAGMLESLAAIGGSRRFDTKRNLEVVRARFREELDYALEAKRLDAFRAFHEGDAKIVVPRVVLERSSASVLTTEWQHGARFEDVLHASEDARRAWAETLWRFVFKGNLVGGMFNADPHPGNYLFRDDGVVVFLDFGCVQELPATRRPVAQRLHRAAIARDDARFDACVSELIDAKPGEMERLARAYTRTCFAPLFESPYRITRTYAASLFTEMKAMALAARKLPDEHIFSMPAEMLFMNRLQFGFYSVLARLDVEVDYAAVESAFLP